MLGSSIILFCGMFDYDVERFRAVIANIVRSGTDEEVWTWLKDRLGVNDPAVLNAAFSLMPRKTGKGLLNLSNEQAAEIAVVKPGFSLSGWTIDRLGRVCLLIHLEPGEKDRYFRQIENLFMAAEVAELVALYSALPLLAWPEIWKMRCAEGVRSNIGSVLEAIMYDNSYPSTYLDDKAWNQLILKAFFTEKDVNRIIGLDERANSELAHTLSDYAHERWAAKRKINPQLWRLTARFMDEGLFNDMKRVFEEGDLQERKAAALTAYMSEYKPALEILNTYPELLRAIEKKELSWERLESGEKAV